MFGSCPKKKVYDIDYSSIFVFNLILSILFYFLLYFSAPYIGEFYNNESLFLIVRVLSLKIIFAAIGLVPYAKLRRDFKQKEIAYVNLISLVCSNSVGILMAFLEFGVWSLVTQQLLNVFIVSCFYNALNPQLINLKFKFSALSKYCRYSIMLLSTSILDTIFGNIYSVILGKFYTTESVGYLNRAKSLNTLFCDGILGILGDSQTRIVYTQQDNHEKLTYLVSRLIEISSFAILPLMSIILIFSSEIILILYGQQWLPSAPMAQIICLATIVSPLVLFNNLILKAKGRTDYILIVTIATNCLVLLSIFFTIKHGIMYMLMGYATCMFLSFFIYAHYSFKLIGYGVSKQINDIKIYIGATIFICLLMWIMKKYLIFLNPMAQILICASTGIAIYLVIVSVYKKHTIVYFKNLIKTKFVK